MEAASRNSIGEGLSEFRKRVLLSPAAVLQAAVVDESVAVASPIYPHILLDASEVARRNTARVSELLGETSIFTAADNPPSSSLLLSQELEKQWPVAASITLKLGCPVMFIANVSPDIRIGTIGIVQGLSPLTVSVGGIAREVKPFTFCSVKSSSRRKQIPLCVAFAVCLDRVQGLSLSRGTFNVGPEELAVDGLVYSALSILSSAQSFHLTAPTPTQRFVPKTSISAWEFFKGTVLVHVRCCNCFLR